MSKKKNQVNVKSGICRSRGGRYKECHFLECDRM